LRERRIDRKFERRIDPSLKFDPAEVGRTTCTDLDTRTNGSASAHSFYRAIETSY